MWIQAALVDSIIAMAFTITKILKHKFPIRVAKSSPLKPLNRFGEPSFLKPPGMVIPAAKVTVAISAHTIKLDSFAFSSPEVYSE